MHPDIRLTIRHIFLALNLFACCAYHVSAQTIQDDSLHTAILRGIELSGRQDYDAAGVTFDEAIRYAPGHPAGYLFKAILFQVMSLDYEVPLEEREYNKLLRRTRDLANGMIERDSRSAEGYFYLGMSHSYSAYHTFRDGKSWVDGLSHGMDAYDNLERCLELDRKAYESMTGLGTYMYWKSRKMDFLTWTPFVEDERSKGIALLKRAEKYAKYTSSQATNSLIWIYIDEERYGDAITSAQRVLRRYPDHRLYLWGLASAAEGLEKWDLARSAYERIVASIEREQHDTRYIELQARAKIALMAFRLGDMQTARQESAWVWSQRSSSLAGLTPDAKDRIERRFEEIEELREALRALGK